MTFFWQNPVDSLRGNCSACALQANRRADYRASVQYPGGSVEGPFPVGYHGESFDEIVDLIARDLKPGSHFRIWKPPSRSRRTYRVTAPGVVVEV